MKRREVDETDVVVSMLCANGDDMGKTLLATLLDAEWAEERMPMRLVTGHNLEVNIVLSIFLVDYCFSRDMLRREYSICFFSRFV